jgi:zinc transport system substrate-binding protein
MNIKIKKAISVLMISVMVLFCLSACGSQSEPSAEAAPEESSGLKIVTTIYPEYDWVMNILGDNPAGAEVILLTDNGVDLHSYQPTAEDIMNITTSDVFVYVGGESDEWAEDTIMSSGENLVAVNLLEALGDSAKEEEVIEGMEAEEHEHEDGEEAEDHEHEEDPEYDEHVWLSLRNASALVDSIEAAIAEADPANADTYAANANAYKEKLAALDAEYEKAVSSAPVKTLLFGDRFPFRYMTDDYGIDYYAAFVGCSAETEASFETVTFLANKLDELGLKSVMTIEGSNQKLANTIIKTSSSGDQQILTLDSIQSVTADDIANGNDYLAKMTNNLEVLKEALK